MIFPCFNCSPFLFSSFGPENSIHYGGTTVLYCYILSSFFIFTFPPTHENMKKNVDLRYTPMWGNVLHRHVHVLQDAKPATGAGMHVYMEWGFWKPLGFSLASIQYVMIMTTSLHK